MNCMSCMNGKRHGSWLVLALVMAAFGGMLLDGGGAQVGCRPPVTPSGGR